MARETRGPGDYSAHTKVENSGIPNLERTATVVLALKLVLVILGICSAVVALFKSKSAQVIGVIVGATISGMTVVQNEILKIDHLSAKRLVWEARAAVTDVRNALNGIESAIKDAGTEIDEATQQLLSEELSRAKAEEEDLNRVECRARVTGQTIAWDTDKCDPDMQTSLWGQGLVLTAHAQTSQAPKWVEQPKPTETRDTFLGKGVCNSLTGAYKYAEGAAYEQAARELQKQSGADLASLVNLVTASSKVSRRYFTKDKDGMYHCDVLISLYRGYTEKTFQSSLVKQTQVAPNARLTGQVRLRTPDLSREPTRRKIDLTAQNDSGRFSAYFDIWRNGADTVNARLVQIDVGNDGSGATSRWSFNVFADEALLFQIPTYRYDDSKRPTVCAVPGTQPRSGQFKVGASFTLRVVGYKPKDID
jgi:hypothetical protein